VAEKKQEEPEKKGREEQEKIDIIKYILTDLKLLYLII
jgi:hypothetical protein